MMTGDVVGSLIVVGCLAIFAFVDSILQRREVARLRDLYAEELCASDFWYDIAMVMNQLVPGLLDHADALLEEAEALLEEALQEGETPVEF